MSWKVIIPYIFYIKKWKVHHYESKCNMVVSYTAEEWLSHYLIGSILLIYLSHIPSKFLFAFKTAWHAEIWSVSEESGVPFISPPPSRWISLSTYITRTLDFSGFIIQIKCGPLPSSGWFGDQNQLQLFLHVC